MQSIKRWEYQARTTAQIRCVSAKTSACMMELRLCLVVWQDSFIVALTDGEDSTSTVSHEELVRSLQACAIRGLLVVAVGNETPVAVLQSLCACTKEGRLIMASSNEAIAEAFAQVAELIGGQVTVEDF